MTDAKVEDVRERIKQLAVECASGKACFRKADELADYMLSLLDDEQEQKDMIDAGLHTPDRDNGRCRFNCRTARQNWLAGYIEAKYNPARKDNLDAIEAYKQWYAMENK